MWTRTLEDHHAIYMCTTVLPPHSRAVTTHCLVVTEDGTWSVTLHGLDLDPSKCVPLNGVPTVLDRSGVRTLLCILSEYKICAGNPDKSFVPLATSRKGVFKSQNGLTITAHHDTQYPVEGEEGTSVGTIRSTECQLLISPAKIRCQFCISHRHSLRSMFSRFSKGKEKLVAPDSHTNLRYLNTPEKQQKFKQMRMEITSTQRESSRLQTTLNALHQQSSFDE